MGATKKYRDSKKGLIAYIFAAQRHRCKMRGSPMPLYDLAVLREYLLSDPLLDALYSKWIRGGKKTADRPSIDRIDPTRGYSLDNIQLTTWMENRRKGDSEKSLVTGTAVRMLDMHGSKSREFASIKDAVKHTGCNQGLIVAVCQKKRNQTGGYKWEYCGRRRCKDATIYEHPHLAKGVKDGF